MAGYGAGRAIGYTDYYNNNVDTPGDNSNPNLSNSTNKTDSTVDNVANRRRAALLRRLRKKQPKVS